MGNVESLVLIFNIDEAKIWTNQICETQVVSWHFGMFKIAFTFQVAVYFSINP